MSSESTDNEMQCALEEAYTELLRPESWNWADEDDEMCPLESHIESPQDLEEGEDMISTTDKEYDDEMPGEANEDSAIQDTIDHVFSWRSFRAGHDSSIHHFNWLGQPVWQRSTTAPTDSLVFIQGKPKTAWRRENYRVQSILNRAMQFVDPVVVLPDDGDTSFLNLKGTALARAAVGRVYKLYSPHGRWVIDAHEKMEELIPDHGESTIYTSDAVAIGSGFISHGSIRTPSDWFEDAALNAEAEAGHTRKLHWEATPSRLGPTSPTRSRAFSGAVRSDLCDGAAFDLHDNVPVRPVVHLPTTVPNAALEDQPSRVSTSLVDGASDAAVDPLSNRVPEVLSGEVLDNLFSTGHDIASEIPHGIAQVSSDGYSDLLFDPENSVCDEDQTDVSSKSSKRLSSQSFIEPSKATFIDLLDRPRVIHYPSWEGPNSRKGHEKRNYCKKALSKAWKGFKSGFGSDHIHLELFV